MILECESRCNNFDIYEVSRGKCQKLESSSFSKTRESFRRRLCHCTPRYDYDPICGLDGRTYENPDQLDCFNECDGQNIEIRHYGECRERPNFDSPTRHRGPIRSRPCDCAPIYYYNPICGSDGRTYYNFEKLACINRCYDFNIYKVHRGECQPESSFSPTKNESPFRRRPCNCTTSYERDPVCGSNGLTYTTFGELKCNNEYNGKHLYVLHKGLCPNDPDEHIA